VAHYNVGVPVIVTLQVVHPGNIVEQLKQFDPTKVYPGKHAAQLAATLPRMLIHEFSVANKTH
jgi:hypothetical protein